LFDRFIGGDPEVGEGMLKDFLTEQPSAHAAMISSKTSREEELERQIKVAEAIGVRTEKVLLASKDHLTADEAGKFADFLRHAANARHLRAIRDAVVKLAKDGQKAAIAKIEEMSLRVLEDIVLRSSRTEGAYEVDTMLRALNIEVTAAVRAELVPGKSEELRGQIRAARQLAEASFLDDKASHDKAEELLAQERYETAETVNAGGLPVANGDVFKINGKAFVLFEPPCDMVMRDTVSSSRDHKHAKLVVLERPGRQRVWALPRYAPFGLGDELEANFAETLHLPLRILDLCSFNADGGARIDLDASEPEVEPLTPGLVRRYQQLTEMATELLKTVELAENPAVKARLLLVDDLQGEAEGRRIKWPVQRLGRLARPVAAAGLAAESTDASRPANLHDLDLFESKLGKDGEEICRACGQTVAEERDKESPGEARAEEKQAPETATAESGADAPVSEAARGRSPR
jgi:hypothetical protein